MNLVQRAYLIRTETEKRQKVGIFWLLVLLFNKGVFFSLFVCELRILSKNCILKQVKSTNFLIRSFAPG